VYGETNPVIKENPDKVRKIVFCTGEISLICSFLSILKLILSVFISGKVYFELVEDRERRNITDIAIVRIEQLVYNIPVLMSLTND